jgi:uncharacterized Zn finger protein
MPNGRFPMRDPKNRKYWADATRFCPGCDAEQEHFVVKEEYGHKKYLCKRCDFRWMDPMAFNQNTGVKK